MNDLGDAGDGDCETAANECTLRDALDDSDGDDTVTMGTGTHVLTEGHIDIDQDVTITGAGSGSTIIDPEENSRVFQIIGNTAVSITGVSFINGLAENGGAINNAGQLTLNDTFFGDNTATTDNGQGDGGAIYNGTDRLEGGSAGLLGFARPTLDISNSTLGRDDDPNEADGGHGGAIFNQGGSVTIDNTAIEHNISSRHGGGILSRLGGQITMTNSSLSLNTAEEEGGGIRCKDAETGFLTMTDSVVSGNEADDDGGGILAKDGCVLTLLRTLVNRNTADLGNGGGIWLDDNTATITESTVSDNKMNKGGDGGGIYNEDTELEIVRSTIANNGHSEGGPFAAGIEPSGIDNLGTDLGGGIYNNSGGVLTMINSTVSGNVAVEGGGLYNQSGTLGAAGIAHLTHVTVTGNRTIDGTAGIQNSEGFEIFTPAELTLKSVLLSNNIFEGEADQKTNCGGEPPTSEGTNLEDADTCDFGSSPGDGDLVNTDPVIGGLGNNGGPTQTHALLGGSPAIDAASNSGCPGEDQRNVSRPQGPACDIGAYEVPVSPAGTTTTPPAAPAPARPARPRVRVAGVRRACVRRSFVARFTITAASGATIRSVRLTVDGRRVRTRVRSRLSVRINVSRLRAGRHRLRLVVTDSAGNRTTVNRRFTKCAAPAQRRAAPRFTG